MEENNMIQRVQYSREELSEKVRVPAVVEQDLKRIISDRLDQCGLYNRVFSRIKTAVSMERKFALKEYGGDRKIQDLVGVRINLYFDDDVQICRDMMEKTFHLIEWSTSQRNEDEFKPTKLNGVFRLPKYLRAQISPETWDMSIDDTFEIQIKTMFFEGWHEIEHDMRYKGEELWSQYFGFSRYFNSILATLELCDKSMVTLFEDLGHELYKTKQWADMIRSHYRLKMMDVQMYPEVEQVLNEDQEQSLNSLAKRLYKTERAVLVDLLLNRSRRIPINVNTIIALLNDGVFHNSKLTEIFRKRDVYNDGRENGVGQTTVNRFELKPLRRNCVFWMNTSVDGNRIRDVEQLTPEIIFVKASQAIYRWTMGKFGELFRDMPSEPVTWQGDRMAYHVQVDMDRENMTMQLQVRHIDLEIGGRVWYSEAELKPDSEGKLMLYVNNGYAEPAPEHMVPKDPGRYFAYPGFYKAITDNVGISNSIACSNRRRILKEEDVPELLRALEDSRRVFPIVLIISKENEEGMMDESWLDQFRVSDFTRTVWRYAHVFTCYEQVGKKVLEAHIPELSAAEAIPGLCIFWSDCEANFYGPEDVENCTYGRHLDARADARTFDIVHGGQAFYHRIVAEIRDFNVGRRDKTELPGGFEPELNR